MTAVTMIDATHSHVASVPANVPKVAGYVTGTPDIAWTAQDWSRFPHSGRVRIDQSPSLQHLYAGTADAGDVESLAGTPATFAAAARQRVSHGLLTTAYGSADFLAQVAAALASEGVSLAHVTAWLANWNLNESQAAAMVGQLVSGMRCVAVQWASPSSNPRTLVPGTSATLATAQVDLSVADGTWFPSPPAPVPVQDGVVVTSALHVLPVTSVDGKLWRG